MTLRNLLVILSTGVFLSAQVAAQETFREKVRRLAEEAKQKTAQQLARINDKLDGGSAVAAESFDIDALVALVPADMHDYELAMSENDLLCRSIIAPFRLSDNTQEVLTATLTQGGKDMAMTLIAGDQGSGAGDVLLQSAKTSARKLNWLPMAQEFAYGAKIHQLIIEQDESVLIRSNKGRVERQYQQADALLEKVLATIDEEHPYDFELLLLDNEDINATALPGGFIHLNTGTLASPHAELVLAHELAHVFQRHQTRETQARLIDSVETVDDLKQLLDGNGDNMTQAIDRAVSYFGAARNFSRQQELHADACAVRIAGRLPGISLDEMIELYVASLEQTIVSDIPEADQTATQSSMLPLQLTSKRSGHPDYPERRETMQAAARDLSGQMNQP